MKSNKFITCTYTQNGVKMLKSAAQAKQKIPDLERTGINIKNNKNEKPTYRPSNGTDQF
jgi:hypothetical protein